MHSNGKPPCIKRLPLPRVAQAFVESCQRLVRGPYPCQEALKVMSALSSECRSSPSSHSASSRFSLVLAVRIASTSTCALTTLCADVAGGRLARLKDRTIGLRRSDTTRQCQTAQTMRES